MRFPSGRRFVAVAVPFALMAGALTFTAVPAHAIDSCTPNQTLIQEAQAAENEGDTWVYAEDVFLDDGDYEAVNYAYLQAGLAFKEADRLYALACA
ncbi:MAG TPA: hypothetical protein VMF87_10975 [Streptosporangiaceae bacterium]|nr:hypothetical protein [Streptosporangiaceae bacterium]